MYCKNCGFEVGKEAKHCPECGSPTSLSNDNSYNTMKSNNTKKIIIPIVIVVIGASSLFFVLNKRDTPTSIGTKNKELTPKTNTTTVVNKLKIYDVKSNKNILAYMDMTETDIINTFGPYYEEDEWNGGRFIKYDDTPAFFIDEQTGKVNIIMSYGSLKVNDKIIDQMSTFEQIEERLGKPMQFGWDEHDYEYYVYYEIEDYTLSFASGEADGSDWSLTLGSR